MSPQERPLRTAVIGTGFVGPHHVDAVRRGGYAEVVALAGTDGARLEARSRQLGIARVTLDARSIFTDPGIDVVHICTPNDSHVALARQALEAGKNVVLEKPVALDGASAWELADLAASSGLHAMVAFTYRGYPMVRRARALVESGDLGEIRPVHGAYLQDWLSEESDYNWRLEPATGGPSRAVADIGSHWFDTIEWVTGLRVEAVCAEFATFIPFRQRPSAATGTFGRAEGATERVAVSSEDAATILLRFRDVARGSFVVSQVSPGRRNAFAFEMAGRLGSLAWEQARPEQLWLGSRGASQMLQRGQEDGPGGVPGVPSLPGGHPEGWSEALRDLLRPFYAAVAAGDPADPLSAPYPTLADGARAVGFVDAAVKSARDHAWVELPLR